MSKGYAGMLPKPEIEFRRFASFIWIFYMVSAIGFYYFSKMVKNLPQKNLFLIYRIAFYTGLLLILYHARFLKNEWLLLFFLMVPVIIFTLKKITISRMEIIFLASIILIFCSQMYVKSLRKSTQYVRGGPNASGYAIARWINAQHYTKPPNMIIYSHYPMVTYYLKNPINLYKITIKKKAIYENRNRLTDLFKQKIINHNIKYIIFDWYINRKERPWEYAIKKMLYYHREKSHDFKLKRTFFYKRKPVAAVLLPRFKKS
jgi:hypothetical protein